MLKLKRHSSRFAQRLSMHRSGLMARGAIAARLRATVAGFTLVEVMITIAIATIVGMAAVGTFNTTIAGYRILGEANGLARDLQFARSEATKRGQSIIVCPSTDGASCVASNTAWAGGWMVFFDSNSNGSFDSGEPVLRWQAQTAVTNSVTADNNVSSIVYNRLGAAAGLPANPVTVKFVSVVSNTTLTRCVAVSPSGRAVVQSAGTGNC